MLRKLLIAAFLIQALQPVMIAEAKTRSLNTGSEVLAGHPLYNRLGDLQAWLSYKRRFISASGRVIDTGNAQISHSEGQGYGLLLALAAGDLDTFRRLWVWTRTELMLRPDALIAWRWDPSSRDAVSDHNDATDGDLLVAWALAEAAFAWPAEGFRQDARRIAVDLGRKGVLWKIRGGPLLLPGVVGFSAAERTGGPIVNLSYWVFPAFSRLADIAPEFDWGRLDKSGLALVRQARFGSTRLPTDWIAMGSGVPRPAPGVPATFAYNAIRIPLYLAMAGDTERTDYAPFIGWWTRADGTKLPVANVETGQTEGWLDEPGYAAIAALALCAADGIAVPDRFETPSETQNYYPATLQMLALLTVRTKYPACLKH